MNDLHPLPRYDTFFCFSAYLAKLDQTIKQMGREASCQLTWGKEAGSGKVLLETQEIILRGGLHRRVLLTEVTHVSAVGGELTFRVGSEKVALELGEKRSQQWADALTTPAPTLARRLGLCGDSHVRVLGEAKDEELKAAISEAGSVNGEETDLILVCVKTARDLDFAIDWPAALPVWIVYAKGKGQEVGESSVREALRNRGFIDTKVASVSAKLTAMRFHRSTTPNRTAAIGKERRLRDLSGIGPSLEANLQSLGIATVAQLAKCDGLDLYQRLCQQTGTRQDPCVLDVFRCAVAQSQDIELSIEKCNWWWWSRQRKAGRLSSAR